ncbi:DMT family transporter [Yoonia sp. MH D7]
MTSDTTSRDNLHGSLWMIVAMAIFAVEDTLVKAVSVTLPVGQIMILFGGIGAAIFAFIARAKGEAILNPDVLSKPMRIRVCFEVFGRLFYFLALALIPLSAATVILQATPLVVVAGAAIVFGEKVGWRRWTAIFIGLAGVLTIIQPGADSFSPLSILAVIGMLGFAGRDLASRAAPKSLSATLLGIYGFLAVLVAGTAFAIWEGAAFVMPDAKTSLTLLGAIIAGVTAYTCLMTAMRTGEVATVTPFRYTRLIFGIALGVLVFGEEISAAMVTGSALIVLSGLFILWQSNRTRRLMRQNTPTL